MASTSLVWLRDDFRLADHHALYAAAERGPVVVAYIHDETRGGAWSEGAASLVWKHHSLDALERKLAEHRVPLVLRRGETVEELTRLARDAKVERVFANRRWEPWAREEESAAADALEHAGVELQLFHGVTLRAPDEVRTGQGAPYKVFTPFWRALQALGEPEEPLPPPPRMASPTPTPSSLSLDELGLLPPQAWHETMMEGWTPGEAGAEARLDAFVEGAIEHYAERRDRPDHEGISRLSPHLRHGELSPRSIWQAARRRQMRDDLPDGAVEPFLRQLAWREFGHALLWHFPHTTDQPFNESFATFPWSDDREALESWQRGRTGYPLVDAAMRELWQTGWMHNRVRMVVASFLTKHLLVSWTAGARWFWDTLVDADLANNSLGWQWTAGCGADAAPYFRVFNPVLQGLKFDPEGAYVRRFVPELAALPERFLHKPWDAPPLVLQEAGVELGRSYPAPLVEHGFARDRALAAYAELRERV